MLRIEALEDVRCFKKGEIFEFPSHVILIGKNGSGKSTLMRAVRGHYKWKFKGVGETKHEWDTSYDSNRDLATSFKVECDASETVFLDAITDDPAHQTYDAPSFISSGNLWASKKSHGEASKILLSSGLGLLQNAKNKLVVLDECDSGFDLPSQVMFTKASANIAKTALQLICVTHSYLLMTMTDLPIFLLDRRQFVDKEAINKWMKNLVNIEP